MENRASLQTKPTVTAKMNICKCAYIKKKYKQTRKITKYDLIVSAQTYFSFCTAASITLVSVSENKLM